jgi:signal peptidase II
MKQIRIASVVAAAVLALDQLVKALVLRAASAFALAENLPAEAYRSPVIPGFFDITFVKNRGGVFGFFNAASEPWHTLLLIVVPMVTVLVLVAFILKVDPADRLARICLALILGGALGNQIDRIRLGYVVDCLDFYLPESTAAGRWLLQTFGLNHWYNFNVADTAIVVGACLLLLDAWRHHRRSRREARAAAGR